MNYIILRVILYVLFIFIYVIISKKIIKGKNLKFLLGIFLIVISVLAYMFPIEKYIIKFDTCEKAFKYYFPGNEFIKKYEYDKYAFVIYKDSNSQNIMYFSKDNGSYEINNLFFKNKATSQIFLNNGASVFYTKVANSDAFALEVLYTSKKKDVLTDSLSSKADMFYIDKSYEYQVTGFIVFDEKQAKKVNNNYRFYFDGKTSNLNW